MTELFRVRRLPRREVRAPMNEQRETPEEAAKRIFLTGKILADRALAFYLYTAVSIFLGFVALIAGGLSKNSGIAIALLIVWFLIVSALSKRLKKYMWLDDKPQPDKPKPDDTWENRSRTTRPYRPYRL